MKRLGRGLVFKAHRLFVSLNSRLESNKEEEEEEDRLLQRLEMAQTLRKSMCYQGQNEQGLGFEGVTLKGGRTAPELRSAVPRLR